VADPVQSIGIAKSLAERFATLSSVAHSGVVVNNVAEMELRIGEAQQIYPEIWRHLEEAYAALVARGITVPRFDELRSGDHARVGVLDVEADMYDGRATWKAARFNIDGHRRAVAACHMLMTAMPEVDWAKLAAQDRVLEATSVRSPSWIGVAIVAAILAIAALYALR
jgi:hypothetical protein